MQKKVKPKLVKIREGSKKKTKVDSNILTLVEMFYKFMTAKKTEGIASRTLDEYYNNYGYLAAFLFANNYEQRFPIPLVATFIMMPDSTPL